MGIAVLVEIMVSFLLGVSLTCIILPRLHVNDETSGTLHIVVSDEENDPPYLFVELGDGLADIANKGRVLLKVDVKDYIPRK